MANSSRSASAAVDDEGDEVDETESVSMVDEDIITDEDSDNGGSIRRRSRRGSSRRRTRP